MPVPKQWYENFMAKMNELQNSKFGNTADYLRTVDNEPVFPPGKIGGEKFNELNENQIQTLYNLASKSKLILVDPSDDHEKKSELNYRVLYNDENGNVVGTNLNKYVAEGYPNGPIKDSIEAFGKIPVQQRTSAHVRNRDLDVIIKTLTDTYPGNNIDDLLDYGYIVDKDGNPFELEEYKGEPGSDEHRWAKESRYTKVYTAMNSEEGVYARKTNVKPGEQPVMIQINKAKNEQAITPKQINDQMIINPYVKKDAIKNLSDVAENLKRFKSKNPNIIKLKDECDKTIETLKGTVKQDDFKRVLNEFAEAADAYYLNNAGTKMKRNRVEKFACCDKIREIRDAVEADRITGDRIKSSIQVKQRTIAERYVKAYYSAMKIKANNTLKKDPENAEALDKLDEVNSVMKNASAFQKAVETTLSDDAFQYLYGPRPEDDEKKLEGRLTEALNGKAASILKDVKKERQYPTPERIELNNMISSVKPQPSRESRCDHKPMTKENIADLKSTLSSFRAELDKNINMYSKSSPAYRELDAELKYVQLRLESGLNFIDIKGDMAKLGDVTEKYLMSKGANRAPRRFVEDKTYWMDRLLHPSGEKMDKWTTAKLKVANQLKNVCDAVERNEKPSSGIRSEAENVKESLSNRLVEEAARRMKKSDDPKLQAHGIRIMTDTKAFEREAKRIRESKTFKDLYDKNPKAAENDLQKRPERAFNKYLKQEKISEKDGLLMDDMSKSEKKELETFEKEKKKTVPEKKNNDPNKTKTKDENLEKKENSGPVMS